jgi:hypothetical protein
LLAAINVKELLERLKDWRESLQIHLSLFRCDLTRGVNLIAG